jgi:hypothetical protein
MTRHKPPRQAPRVVRGVPYRDYRTYARAVRNGETTWAELENSRLVGPRAGLTDAYHKLRKLKARKAKAK